MLRYGLAVSFVLFAGSAYAGCANYVDGSLDGAAPRAKICVHGTCEETVLESECGNASGVQASYASGWGLSADESGVLAKHNGVTVRSKVICKDIDQGACPVPMDEK